MNYNLKKLASGLNLITAPLSGTQTTTVLMVFATGSKYETANNNGISHFLEHMFFKGTEKRPTTLDISSALDQVGAEFNAFTSKEFTGYWVKTASKHVPLALDVLSDMLLHSKFDSQEIKREKGVIIEEINMYLDNPQAYVEDLFESGLYKNQPAGLTVLGPKKNIRKFTQKDFLNYWQTQYGNKNAYLIIAGKIPQNTTKLANKYFAELKKNKYKKKVKTIDKQIRPQINLHYKKTDQAHLFLGVRSFPKYHPQEPIAKMISLILGGSMSSRLFIQLRERNGLAYYVRTRTEAFSDTGYLATQAGVQINKLEKAIQIILEEYQKIKKELVSPAELKRVQQLIEGHTFLQLEASDNLALWYGLQAARQQGNKKLKLIAPEKMIQTMQAITPQQIKKTAEKIFINSQLNLAIIGPYKDKKPFQKILKL